MVKMHINPINQLHETFLPWLQIYAFNSSMYLYVGSRLDDLDNQTPNLKVTYLISIQRQKYNAGVTV